jgi:hypothetical protein
MSAGSNSSRNHKNSLAQRAHRAAGRMNDHTDLTQGETFHEKKPVAGAFGPADSDPEQVFRESPQHQAPPPAP